MTVNEFEAQLSDEIEAAADVVIISRHEGEDDVAEANRHRLGALCWAMAAYRGRRG